MSEEKRKRVGRKPLHEHTVRTAVSLDKSQQACIAWIGEGNFSGGVRELLDFYLEHNGIELETVISPS